MKRTKKGSRAMKKAKAKAKASTAWLSGDRAEALAMAVSWVPLIDLYGLGWGMSAKEIEDFTAKVEKAVDLSNLAADKFNRTTKINQAFKAAMEVLKKDMRYIHRRYLQMPPLNLDQFQAMGLHVAKTPESVKKSLLQVTGTWEMPGPHLLDLMLKCMTGKILHPTASEHGVRIFWGIMPVGGATLEVAAGIKRELMKAALSGAELPFSVFTRKEWYRFSFDPADAGKTIFVCMVYENAKGEAGDWGPMLTAVIPL